MKQNHICKFMIFLIVVIVKHENAERYMYGSDGRNKWRGKQDSQLSLSWGRPHPLCSTDDNDDKGSTLSLMVGPKNGTEKMMNDKVKLVK